MKIYTIIAGVNGAGKSSLTGSLRAERTDLGVVVDPDKITAELGGDEYEGGKRAVERIERALADGVNLTQETTLSGGYPKRLARRAKEAGYYIRLYYVGLDTLDESPGASKTAWKGAVTTSPPMTSSAALPAALPMWPPCCPIATKPNSSITTTGLSWWPSTATASCCRSANTGPHGCHRCWRRCNKKFSERARG